MLIKKNKLDKPVVDTGDTNKPIESASSAASAGTDKTKETVEEKDIPVTSDSTNVLAWVGILLTSGLGVLVLGKKQYKKQ